jgi:hypothetical protein
MVVMSIHRNRCFEIQYLHLCDKASHSDMGTKMWSTATRSGYLTTFKPYQGMKSAALPEQDKLGLGAFVVLGLTLHLPKHLWPYSFYFNNFFTSLPLLSRLSEKGIGGTGSIRENHLQKCLLQNTASLKKERPSTMSFKAHKDVLIVKWNDNSIVTVASNCRGITQTCEVEKIDTADGKKGENTISM